MNTRKIPTSVPALIAFAAGCLAGARKYGAVLLLAQNTAARVGADFVDLVGEAGPNPAIRGREATWQLTREELAASRAILRHAKAAARDYWSDVVDLLKIHLGRTWNAAWEAAGFTRFTLGTSRGEPLPMLLRIRSYLRDHAAHENAPLNITAAQTEVHIAAIETAEHAVAVANAACKKAAASRDCARSWNNCSRLPICAGMSSDSVVQWIRARRIACRKSRPRPACLGRWW
jgi:hypothetical protein